MTLCTRRSAGVTDSLRVGELGAFAFAELASSAVTYAPDTPDRAEQTLVASALVSPRTYPPRAKITKMLLSNVGNSATDCSKSKHHFRLRPPRLKNRL